MTTSIPYSWLKQLPASALNVQTEFPFGTPPTFPWEQFSAVFAKVFQLEGVKIEASNWEFRQEDELFAQLGSQSVALHCDVSTLKGTFWFVMSEKEREQLMSLLLTNKLDGEVIDKVYQKAFLEFLALELFSICNKLEYQKDLTPHILHSTELPNEACFTQDISIKFSNRTFNVRMIASEELRNSWKERFAERSLSLQIPKAMAEKIKVTLRLEGGSTAMSLGEWKQSSVGDFLLLDRTTLRSGDNQGTLMITLFQQPFFLAQVKDGNVKILDYPLYHEAPATMVTNDDDELDEFEIENNHTFSDDLSDMSDENTTHNGHTTLHDDTSKHDTTSSNATMSHDSSISDHEIDSTTQAHSVKTPPNFTPSADKPLNPNNIPVTVVIEVGRIEMTIQRLVELQPGSLLDLNVHPEDGVDLTINGQIVAKGELLKIGDSLGVRILDKG
ncbi:MAG: type III secretion system cytoplasmic ring protein SctQ [Parachlamydiaceae bacterium]|nr:type III secretion system cytoplasmic ring protein SctQ [Parachlamydiaceae bacterium]